MNRTVFAERAAPGIAAVNQEQWLSPVDFRCWKPSFRAPPLFIEPLSPAMQSLSGFTGWLAQNIASVRRLLTEQGAIVFRGFPVHDTAAFNAFLAPFETYSPGYAGGATPRRKIAGQVFEATQLAGSLKIPLHQEMAYLKDYPGRLAFFCCKPAEEGGETIIGDMRRITRSIPLELRRKLEKLGVMGIRNFTAPPPDGQPENAGVHPDQRSWKFGFYTDDKAEVDAICAAKSLEPIWHDDGSLTVRTGFDAFVNHPLTGERIYRSVLHLGDPYDACADLPPALRAAVDDMRSRQKIKSGNYLGDGTALSADDLAEFRTIYAENEITWAWQAGDIMLLDNLLVAHGRNPFVGTRNVQVGLLA